MTDKLRNLAVPKLSVIKTARPGIESGLREPGSGADPTEPNRSGTSVKAIPGRQKAGRLERNYI